jgi:hypothetical protein
MKLLSVTMLIHKRKLTGDRRSNTIVVDMPQSLQVSGHLLKL